MTIKPTEMESVYEDALGKIKQGVKNGIILILPQFDNGIKSTETVYSDRLYQWDPKKHNDLCQKFFGNHGQYWGNRTPENIQSLLREYYGNKNILLCKIEEFENQSSGYPYWRFDFKHEKLK